MTSKLVFFAVLALSTCAEIPSNLKKCSRKDADFKKCLLEAIQEAFAKSPIKEIGFSSWDPLDIPSLVIGAGTGPVGFQQNFKNMKMTGLSKLKCSSIDFNAEAKTFAFDCGAPLIVLEFHYEINGKILVLPIYGKGPGSITLIDPTIRLVFNLEEFDKKGKKHYKVASQKMNLAPKLIKFKLDNLFDGDKALGDNINQVLNDNWAEVYLDVQKSYEEAFGKIFGAVANGVFGKVSVEELFSDA